MGDLLEQAANWLGGMRKQFLSRQVTYCRGSDCVMLAATIGKSDFERTDAYGVVQTDQSRDFLVAAVDMVLGGATVTPQPGDRIKEVAGGRVLAYEVMAPGGEDCWRYSDPFRQTVRIHTKFVGVENA